MAMESNREPRKWRVCRSDELQDGALGKRFQAEWAGSPAPGFVVRYEGRLCAYLNECQHVPIELDFNEGDFFDLSKTFLICSTHGALYRPHTGECVGGPCRGRRLTPLHVEELDGDVFYLPDARI